jgi:hypothetical protein
MASERPLAADTTLRAERLQFEVWSRMTPAEKFTVFAQLMEMATARADAGIRQRHPDADEHEIFLRRVALHLDRATMLQAYGWDPAAHP